MPRQPVEVTNEQFYALLNSHDDLTAVIHGLASIEARLDEALGAMLVKGGLRADVTIRHSIQSKARHLIDADRLDPEFAPLLSHLVEVRNRFAHQLQTAITAEDGARAWDLMPGGHDRAPLRMARADTPGMVVRWCMVLLFVRIQNRAIYGNEASIPWA